MEERTPGNIHKISLKPNESLIWVDGRGNKQTVAADPNGTGISVETEIHAPVFDDGTGEHRVVETKTTQGPFSTNFPGTPVTIENTG